MHGYDPFVEMGQDDARAGRGTRYLPAAFVVVAASSFVLTTAVWRLVRQTQAVEAAVHESIHGINRLGAANSDEWTRLRSGLAGQTAATATLSQRLQRVESAQNAALDRIQALGADMARQWAITDQMRHELTRAAAGISESRQEIMERLAVHADRNATARDAMIREVNAAISHMERALLAQAEDFQQQKQLFDAAAERDRASRRALLSEATQAFTVQVEGLRQILDGLRAEAGAVEAGVSAGEPKAATDVGAVDAVEAPVPEKSPEPATATRPRDLIVE